MKYLLCGVAAVAMLTACGKSDSKDPASKPIGDISIRDGDPAEAPDALAAMMLSNSGDGAIQFDSKELDGDKATFKNLVATSDGSTVRAGSLVLDGLDMIDGKAAFSMMSLKDISIESDEMDDGTLGIGNIELLNPTPELASWFAASLGQSSAAPFPTAEKFGFDAWSVSDVAATMADEDGDGTFSIAKMEVRDLKDEKAALAMIKDVAFSFTDAEEGYPINMSLGAFKVSNVDASFIEAMQENSGDGEAMMEAIMEKAYENPMDPGYDTFTLDKFAFDAAGASFKLPSLDASVKRNSKGQPVQYVTKPFSMTLDADPDGGEAGASLAQGLSMIGYESIELKAASTSDYDPDSDTISFKAKDNYFELVDGATFSFGGDIAGYAAYSKKAGESLDFEAMAEGQEPDTAAMQAALGELKIGAFELKIKDDSLVNRIFNAVAAQSGEDPEQMRQQVSMMMGMAPMMAQGSGVDMELVTELATAVSAFITDPGTLTIEVAPEQPLSVASLAEMEDPSLLTKEYLGFSASHK